MYAVDHPARCRICNKPKGMGPGVHAKCSRILQKQFAEQREQEAEAKRKKRK